MTAEELINCAEMKQVSSVAFPLSNGETPQIGAEASEPAFERINAGTCGATGNAHPHLLYSVAGMGDEAVRPVETLIYQNVFSNPRMQVVTRQDDKFMLRILPVVLADGTPRTRLTVSRYEDGCWGEPHVVGNGNFKWAESRADLYDYDFAVAMYDRFNSFSSYYNYSGVFRMVLISGTRPNGLDTGMTDAMANTVLTLVELDEAFNVVGVISSKTYPGLDAEGKHTMVSLPFIDTYHVDIPAVNEGSQGYSTIAGAFVRVADTADALASGPFEEYPVVWADGRRLNTKKATDGFNPVMYFDTGNQVPYKDSLEKTSVNFAILRPEESEMTQLYACWAFTYKAEDGTPTLRLFSAQYAPDQLEESFLSYGFGQRDYPHVTGVQPWFNKVCHGTSSIASQNFYERRFEGLLVSGGTQEEPVLQRYMLNQTNPYDADITEVSLANSFPVTTFQLSEDGNTLFYVSTNDTESIPTYDALGNEIPCDPVQDYAVCAQTCVVNSDGEYRFVRPFSLCHVDNPIDAMVVSESADAYCFLSTTVTDLSKSLSDIYYFTVPKLLHATVTNFHSKELLVCAGEPERFIVTLRNDGNKVISACGLEIRNSGGSLVDRISLDLGSASVAAVKPASATVPGGEPSVSAVEEDKNLIPTDEREYEFTWKVPEDWSGDVEVTVRVEGGTVRMAALEQDALTALWGQDAAAADYSARAMMGCVQGSELGVLAKLVKPHAATISTHAFSLHDVADDAPLSKSSYSWAGPGWRQNDDGTWSFYDEDGNAKQSGWLASGNDWYYFEGAKAVTGWKRISGEWYYFHKRADGVECAAHRGWFNDGGRWYYLNKDKAGGHPDCAMRTGWLAVGSTWYYLSPKADGGFKEGQALTGWKLINGEWYYFNKQSDGVECAARRGWFKDGNTWYFLNERQDGGHPDCAMRADTWIGRYYVDASGAWTKTR